MNTKTCVAAVVLALICGCKRPSPEAWTGEIAAIDAINGMTASFVLEDGSRLSGMRAGSRLPAGTTIETQPGVLVELTLDGARVVLEGGARLQLDRYQPRAARLLEGRAVMVVALRSDPEFRENPARLLVNDHTVQFDGKVAAEVSASLSTAVVLQGHAWTESTRAGVAQVLHLDDVVSVVPAFDIADRSWFEPREKSAPEGYGHVDGDVVELVDHLVRAELDDHFATTTITESFRNTADRNIDLRYRYTLPDDAVLTEVAVRDADGKWMTSVVEPRGMAAQTYADARSEGRAAVLLSSDHGQVTARIANVQGKSERRVRVTYVQPLRPTAGGARYTYEMPRDSSGTRVAQQFGIEVTTARSPQEVAVYGYGATVAPSSAGAMAEFAAANFSPTGDLSVVVRRPELTATTYARGAQRFVAVTAQPAVDVPTRSDADLLIVIDTSTSRRPHQASIRAVSDALVEHLPAGDRAMFATCAARCMATSEGFVREPTRPDLAFGGTTNVAEVSRFAARQFEKYGGGRARHVIYVSDAVPSAGDLGVTSFADDLVRARARLVLVDVSDVTTAHAHIANATESDVVIADPQRPLTSALRILASTSATPLTNLRITLPTALEHGAHLPLLPGGQMTLVGRATDSTSGAAELHYTHGGRVHKQTVEPQTSSTSSAAPTIWASRRLRRLEAAPDGATNAQARELALEYALVSQQTSLVAVGQHGITPPTPSGISRRGIGLANIGQARNHSASGTFGRGAQDLGERRARVPMVVPGRPIVQGQLDKEIIRRVVRQHRRELRFCYEEAAHHTPGLKGRVEIRLTISTTGTVVSAVVKSSTLNDRNAEACMTAKIRRWVFPTPKKMKGVVIVTQSFDFSGGGVSPPPPAINQPIAARPVALEALLEAVEHKPDDVTLHEDIATSHDDPAIACAHRQSAASLQGETLPVCATTSAKP